MIQQPNQWHNTVLNLISKTHKYLFVFPLVWISSIYVYAIRSRLILGYWPYPYHPDPTSDILFNSLGGHYAFTVILMFICLYLPILFVLLAPVLFYSELKTRIALRIVVFLAANFIVYSIVYADPFEFVEWFLD